MLTAIALALPLMAADCAQTSPAQTSRPVEQQAPAGTSPAPVSASAPDQTAGGMGVGTNLDPLAYWGTALPLMDYAKSSGGFLVQRHNQWDTKEPLDLDQNGWPRAIPDGASLALIILRGTPSAAPPHARYVVLYAGEGTLEGMDNLGTRTIQRSPGRVVIEAAADSSVHLRIRDTDPRGVGDHIRDIRVVREDQLAAFQSGGTFNPAFLERLRGFQAVRFMDWMHTNTLYRADGSAFGWSPDVPYISVGELDWDDRPKPTDARWSDGVPVEVMVRLANELDIDPWFNMPINASDDYVRGFAQYVQRNLEPGRKVRVELSNEVWNWGFPQAQYSKERSEKEFGQGAHWLEWYGKRSAEVGAIWNQVFAEPATGTGDPGRAIVVFGTQFAWKGLEKLGLDTEKWKDAQGNRIRAADYFDEYAVASYYEGGMHEAKNAAEVMSWWNDADGGYQKAIAALRKGMEEYNKPLFPYHGEQARNYGLDLVAYEAGYGAFTPTAEHANDRYTNFLIDVSKRPEIYDLDMANGEALRNAGGTLFVNFTLIGAPSKWGSWGVLETVNQQTSHRYRALRTLIDQRKIAAVPSGN